MSIAASISETIPTAVILVSLSKGSDIPYAGSLLQASSQLETTDEETEKSSSDRNLTGQAGTARWKQQRDPRPCPATSGQRTHPMLLAGIMSNATSEVQLAHLL